MASFLPDLWSSIFTPGATPTLIVATNAAFAALQLLLLVLLVATYSVHFAILSVLCGGLWYAINWFAVEVKAAQEAEAAAARRRRKDGGNVGGTGGGVAGDADDEGEDTEVDEGRESVSSLKGSGTSGHMGETYAGGTQGTASGVQPGLLGVQDGETRVRKPGSMVQSEISTDSEWEEVSHPTAS